MWNLASLGLLQSQSVPKATQQMEGTWVAPVGVTLDRRCFEQHLKATKCYYGVN